MPVTVISEGAVHIITLDSGKNVFNPDMLSQIHAAIDQVEVRHDSDFTVIRIHSSFPLQLSGVCEDRDGGGARHCGQRQA